jgi:hypothetical protein
MIFVHYPCNQGRFLAPGGGLTSLNSVLRSD